MPQMRRVRISDKTGEPIPREVPGTEVEACDCPVLDPADWHEVESDWTDITFIKTATTALIGVPLGFGGTRAALAKKARDAGVEVPEDAMLLIGAGKFRRPVMLEVEDVAAGKKGIERPGGIVYTRLVSAPWGKMGEEMALTVAEARIKYGREADNTWVWYLTCAKCSGARNFETLFVAHYKQQAR